MNILIISHEYPPIGGGGANACMHLANEYSKMGHKVTILTVWYKGLRNIELDDNICIYRLHSRRKRVEHCTFIEMADFIFKALPVANKLVIENCFDICQVFFGIPSGIVGYYLRKRHKLPYIIRFGGGDIPGFQDRFTVVYRIIAPCIRIIWRNAEVLVANSKGLKQMANAFYSKKEIYVIPNGADIPSANNNEIERDGSFKILFVSRLIERKGVQDFLPQLRQLSNRCAKIGKKVVFTIVGDGPYRNKLERIVTEESITDLVEFCGQKSKQELPQYYLNADIFVFPSKREGMPNVVLEAMSYGLPVIMTHCEGSDELIDRNGFVLDVEDFANAIYEVINDKNLLEIMGLRSKQIILERFLWEDVANKYVELINRCWMEKK